MVEVKLKDGSSLQSLKELFHGKQRRQAIQILRKVSFSHQTDRFEFPS